MLLNNKKCSNCHSYYDPTLNECPLCHKSNELYEQRHVPRNIVFFHPATQIGLFLMGFAYIGMLITEFIVSFAVIGLEGKEALSNIIVYFFTYLLMCGGLLVLCFTTRRHQFIKSISRPFDYLFGLGYAGAAVATGIIIGLITDIFYKATNSNQATVVEMINNYPILAGLTICIFGPICEEITYRVGLYSFLRRIDKYLAFVVTMIIFALIHFEFGAKDMIAELWALPSYLACGFFLTLAYEHRGPACSITAHMLYNATSMVLVIIESIYGQ